jgi:hypothetical protein
MCRKWTSSLLAQFLVLRPAQICGFPFSWPSQSSSQYQYIANSPVSSSYAEYQSSPNRHRGFCAKCGSTPIWRSSDRPETLDLFLGTVDEEWLVRDKEMGKALATPNQYQF